LVKSKNAQNALCVRGDSAGAGGDGVGGTAEEAVADAFGAVVGSRGFDEEIGFFAEFAEAQIDV